MRAEHIEGNLWRIVDAEGAELTRVAARSGATSAQVLAIYADAIDPPAPSLEEVRTAALAALADRRWRAETAGIVVAGAAIMTDRDSQALLTGAALAAMRDPALSIRWKAAGGVWVDLPAADVLAIADTVRAHVQACFDHEAGLAVAITAAETAEAVSAIDIDAGWPAVPL